MKIICSYCRKDMGEKPPLEDTVISHSMCNECHDWFMRGYKGLNLADHMDEFDFPVFVVNPDGRIVCMNKSLAGVLGVANREVEGLLGGEAFFCVYSRLPEGCGKTTHCLECTIRNTIMSTRETGESVREMTTYLVRKEGKFEVVISIELEAGLVRVQIHSLRPAT